MATMRLGSAGPAFAFLLVGCGDHASSEVGESAGSPGECPIDTCATLAIDEASGVACCIDSFGTGLDGEDLDALTRDCEGDACDPSLYVSEEAAICAAQVCGLSGGIGECWGWFQYGASGGTWIVGNEQEECDPDANLCGGGECFQIDAATGACEGACYWSN